MSPQTTKAKEKAVAIQKQTLNFKYSTETVGKFQELIDQQRAYIDGQEINDEVEIWEEIVKFNQNNLYV